MLDENRVEAIRAGAAKNVATDTYMEGIMAGFIGAIILAAWFFVLDTVSGQPLYTPSALGTALFRPEKALAAPSDVAISWEMTAMYTWVHVLLFIVFGGIASRLLLYAESNPTFGFGILLLFVFFEFGFVVAAFLFARSVLGLLAWPAVLVGNLLAAGGMVTYLWFRHRNLTIFP